MFLILFLTSDELDLEKIQSSDRQQGNQRNQQEATLIAPQRQPLPLHRVP